jgi:type VI secretion system protein ImpA
MASPPLLDFAALIEPIPGDNPAGDALPFAIREKLEKGRKEEDPNDYAPDDPMRPEKPVKADWSGIVESAKEALTQTSKDLLVAARLTEALVKLHGFTGLRDGFHLLREMVEQCWDRIWPPLEEGDLEVRASPFNWLDEADRGARFPTTLRKVPFVTGPEGRYGWLEWRQSQDGKGDVSREVFDQAVAATSAEDVDTALADLNEALAEMSQLAQLLDDKLGKGVAPAFTGMRQAAEEARGLLTDILQRKRPASALESDSSGDGSGAATGAPRAVTSRAEAYRQLAHAAAVLQELEPHSPIPYLVQRAVELGSLPFPQLIRQLIRDPNVLNELSREFGIKQTESAAEG